LFIVYTHLSLSTFYDEILAFWRLRENGGFIQITNETDILARTTTTGPISASRACGTEVLLLTRREEQHLHAYNGHFTFIRENDPWEALPEVA
jgi:hypothetical protein